MSIDIGKWQLWISSKALKLFRKYSVPRWIVFMHDNIAVFITFLLAYILRFNFFIADFAMDIALEHAIVIFSIYCIFSLVFHSYSGMIRHTTIIDIFYVFMTTTLSAIVAVILLFFSRFTVFDKYLAIPLSIIIIHYVLITVYLFAVRITIKTLYHLTASLHSKKKKVLIFGAGALGVIVKRLLLSDIKGEFQVAGFMDSNKSLHGKKLNGIPVYSPQSITKDFLNKHGIGTMIFAIRDISPTEKSDIIRSALDLGLEVRDIPAVETWLNGELQMKQIEKVKLEELLGREQIQLNLKRIGLGLRGKTILVTGAAGSIGSEIVRQLTRFPVKTLVLVDQAETPMYHLQNELRSGYSECPVEIILADATIAYKMENIFKEFRPEIVFHAAAYKHVPLMEENPHEAVRVNAGGTKLITKLSVEYGVEKFVMISTDKAVNPTNIMGASKRLCEIIVQIQSQNPSNKTQFIITRFGNVLGSNGSVIPLFTKQIAEGGPITVTHPDVTRYFMTIPEACQLVLEAGFMGKGGELFVFDMGHPVKIADLANQMIRLSGFVPDKDIKIVFTGLRPGEKLYEELLTHAENTLPTYHPKINIARVESFNSKEKFNYVDSLLTELYKLTKYEIVLRLRQLVPEYISNNQEFNALIENANIIEIEEGKKMSKSLRVNENIKRLN